ncbi:MAG TPA: type III restriction endonuclease subunit R, partial [Thermoleophilia bacterium]|nr:type III restriction endonuclease subunit R [Thermoleophilia bacterium]
PWYTGRPTGFTQRSHVNFCVFDGTWESTEEYEIDHNPKVAAWVKNDHLGFEIPYIFQGVRRKYRPDFLIRLVSGKMLVLEVKGQDSQENKTKREFLDQWVKAVNGHGGFGDWEWAVSYRPREIADILEKL